MKRNYNKEKKKILKHYEDLSDLDKEYLYMFKINRNIKRYTKNLIENGITQHQINCFFKHESVVSRAIHQLVADKRMAVFKLGNLNYLFLLKAGVDWILYDMFGKNREAHAAFYEIFRKKCNCGTYFKTILFQNDIRQWCDNCQKYNLNFEFFYIDEVMDSNYPIQKSEKIYFNQKVSEKFEKKSSLIRISTWEKL